MRLEKESKQMPETPDWFRHVGNSGLRVSTVGLGCNNFGRSVDLAKAGSVVHKALDVGITTFDTADIYGKRGGSETILGEVLGDRRKDVVLATKFGIAMDDQDQLKGASRRYVISAVEASLRRLKTDWIDLYQLHWPDPLTPIEETLRALDDLITQGKVRYIGCSNLRAWQVVDAHWVATSNHLSRFVSCEDEYNVVVRDIERELLPAMQSFGLGLLPYYPLASGLLSGKYGRDLASPPPGSRLAAMPDVADRYRKDAVILDRVEKLRTFASERGRSLVELAFSWLAAQKSVSSIIAGATSPDQVEQNAKACAWRFSAEDLVAIDQITS
jgi:aryl-alcohol dehydrogenase-like predicted oxidoreductase